MFGKLKRRLALIYTGIFALILVIVVAATVIIGGVSVIKNEKEMLIADIHDEWREWTGSGELPVDPVMVERGEMMSLLYDGSGKLVVDQMSGSPYAQQLMLMREKWPQEDGGTEILYFENGGEKKFILTGMCRFVTNGTVQGDLYTFVNLEDYYDMAVDGFAFLLLLCLVCIVTAGGGGYYMAAKNIKPLELLFKREHEFAANASHELRTPLTVLSLGIESLQNDTDSKFSPYAEETLRDMQQETQYMSKLTEALLTLARGDEDNVTLQKQKVDLTAVMAEVCAQLRPLAEQKNLQLVFNGTRKEFSLCDKDKIKQLLIILVDNAIKYSDSGTITAEVEADGMQAVIRVLDEGIGITEGEAERIFERFYRVDKARSRASGGFGLGLSIAQWIVKRHGGSITAHPRDGGGTVFTVRLALYR